MQSLHQTQKYNFLYDRYYGAARFIRLEDKAVSLLETGSDGLRLKTKILKLAENGQDIQIDKIAEQHFFDKEE